MTPREVLEEVKSRFIVLYHKDENDLKRLLRRSLLKFQDKAGAIKELWVEDDCILCPDNMKAPAACCDSERRFISYRWDTTEKTIELNINKRHKAPYCLFYFLDLQHWNFDTDLPHDVTSLVSDYLEALIALPNSIRQREAYLLTDMASAAQELPTVSELKQSIADLETSMEEHKAIVPPHSYF